MNYQALITSTLAGDQEAFREIVETLEPKIVTTVINLVGDRPEVRDVAQDTFVKLYQSLGNFRGDATLETYAVRIAVNLSLNELKRRQRRDLIFRRLDEMLEPPAQADPDMHERADDREEIRRALDGLSPKLKAVVTLRLIQGYSVKETAVILKLPGGTVLSRLARAQEKLQRALKSMRGASR